METRTILKPQRRPTPPGEILRAHYLEPRSITITDMAKAVECSRKHMSRVVNGEARLEAALAVRIAKVLDTTPEFWMNLQNSIDLYDANLCIKEWRPSICFHKVA